MTFARDLIIKNKIIKYCVYLVNMLNILFATIYLERILSVYVEF